MRIPSEVQKKIKLLEMSALKKVNNLFGGEYHTAFKGQGMTFADFREYVPGDDVRAISWPLTARTGKTYIKKFEEERELTVVLVLDVSGSVEFGGGHKLKGEVMAEIAALIALAAIQNKDQVGALLIAEDVEKWIPPGKGRSHVLRILRELFFLKPKTRGTDLGRGAEFLASVLKKRAHIFLISDFQTSGYESALRSLSKRHEVVGLVVEDKIEKKFLDLGLIEIEDAETGETLLVDSSSRDFQREYELLQNGISKERQALLKKSQIDSVEIQTGREALDQIIQFFRRRQGQKWHNSTAKF